MIEQLLDAILPGDDRLEMPKATDLGLHNVLLWDQHQQLLIHLKKDLEELALQTYTQTIESVNKEQFLLLLEKAKRRQIQVVLPIINHALALYYSHPKVQNQIGAGSVPPYPKGNSIKEIDDWGILEAVYNRGKIYREIDS